MNSPAPLESATNPSEIAPEGTAMNETPIAEPESVAVSTAEVDRALRAAGQRVAPVWPLERFVAVNPYLGLADRTFGDAAELLARTAGARSTMPIAYYLDAYQEGRITPEALSAVLAMSGETGAADPGQFLARCRSLAAAGREPVRMPTVARVATALTGADWVHLATERISAWAASYFDRGQAAWRAGADRQGAFAAWRDEATIDRTPDVMGLAGFRAVVRSLPQDHLDAAAHATAILGIRPGDLTAYLHALLMQVGGWAAHCARLGFEASLHGQEDHTMAEFGAIALGWELALLETLPDRGIVEGWARERDRADWSGAGSDPTLAAALLLQEALDRSEQERLIASLGSGADGSIVECGHPDTQAAFCIDVRSEVFRRHLEASDDGIQTVGFAGFFGLPIDYVPIAHERGEAHLPVLLTPAHTVTETVRHRHLLDGAIRRRRLSHHVHRAWKSFKMGAISCFSFVGPVGLLYLPKLFTDSAGRTRPTRRADVEGLSREMADDRVPSLTVGASPGGPTGIEVDARIALAEGLLLGTSLNGRLAPLVLLVGHGASTVNNPYQTALHCGACGGNTGEANARVAAMILNDPDVRAGLAQRGLEVPAHTWFLAALHDTTTDEITLFDRELVPSHLIDRLGRLESSLSAAGRAARRERSLRLNLPEGVDVDSAVFGRSTDWAQIRPEWGLAGCRSFIAAPRHRTIGVDLGGTAFLHSYDWRCDEGFGVLELILTAPVVVASWISLQYYASTVDPHLFGSGNKTLHNVVGRLGVLEGNGGDLRIGLPWQSVHDGRGLQHDPLRLNVVVEAPTAAIDEILAHNRHVADLFDHGWIHLLVMDDDGTIRQRYLGEQCWEPV